MTPDQVRALAAAGESMTVEFKSEARRQLNDKDLVEAVTCLANGTGGTLLLGVEDEGSITGARPRHGSATEPHRVQALIANQTSPGLATTVSLQRVGDVDVLVVEIESSTLPVGTKGGVFRRRAMRLDGKPECIAYSTHDILSQGFSAVGRDYAQVRAPGVAVADLSADEFTHFRELAARGSGDSTLATLSDEEVCRALRVIDLPSGEVTLGAVLLFGSADLIARLVPTHEVLFQEMRSGRIITQTASRSALFTAATDLERELSRRNTEDEVLSGMVRVAVPRLPPRVIRETVANALVHRDYTELGPVNVQLDQESLTVRSPGGLPPGITLDNILFETNPRSPILAEAFKRAGLVDRAGKGVGDIYRSLISAGRGEPDYGRTTSHSVTVVVPTSRPDLDMVRFVAEYERDNPPLELRDLRLVHEIRAQGSATTQELGAAVGMAQSLLRPALTGLVERGVIEVRGAGRQREYHLSSGFYALAEDRSAYVRVRPLDPMQQEQMVSTYVDEYGSITRGQVMDLCRLDASRARGLLKRLVVQGVLEMRGERRGAHYVRSGT